MSKPNGEIQSYYQMLREIADLCDQLGMKKLAVMWKKAAAACRQFSPQNEPAVRP